MADTTEHLLNALFASPLSFWMWLVVSLSVLVLSFRVLRHQPLAIRIISSSLFAFACGGFSLGISLSWVLRDGTGGWSDDDGIDRTSHGAKALAIFMRGFVPTVQTTGVIVGIALLLCCIPWVVRYGRKA